MSLDLDAYFARIGYTGPREPTLAVLRRLHTLQPAAIPFENLDPLLERPVRLDLDSLQEKLVRGRRGGYCFEINGLFRAVLEQLGFELSPLIARVRWMAPPERPEGPRSHTLMRVELPEGPFLADVGFGGYLVAEPLRYELNVEQETPGGRHRIIADGPLHTLQVLLSSGWQDVYRFTLEPAVQADYEAGNWWTSTHPTSLFRNALLMERLTPEARYSLLNNRLIERRDGEARERLLASAAELGAVLDDLFGLTTPEPIEAVWARLPPG
ncbi:arylamine N-acetyltransferase family protein [Phenylobacterium montanum]|uniref:Arylamine N-acetyltransferase n=1 Tax=Phenylobacterium montanum TaxID=2823693 RepID=A0A975IVW8_9CAUL|nr:arylamine N-acetyltransferase [Caulobacter sp. S6]QUD89220.1 arylamine N-acetyltransferase [Caulobacter sp. S6]